ncbi:epoxide hydrolase family protein [Herbiconiux daphne]|uniref:Epoxide hydrolase n=1 Tax=Herbiconiux daphne TaxID=2970914 RepID=A0ABT2GW55_9MICO|nr:epoxide hydrolase family protein [Herbiconiux daphne]MCS5732136.1 epoxide hydrolase [Herbiconiux daphne]
MEPFTIDVADDVLDDLRGRLARARFVAPSRPEYWAAGVPAGYLESLVSTWRDDFDWRAVEARLNRHPQFVATVAGTRMHFVRLAAVRGPEEAGREPLPILLSHGWPSSFVEMLPLAERLADPVRFGDDGEAFDVVIPSLPGFLFSGLPEGPLTRKAIADLLHALMTEVLGYERYGAFGGDIGGAATAWLGAEHPEQVVGIQMIHPPFPSSFDDATLSPEEEAFLAFEGAYDELDGGYSAMMITRPDTIAAALIDSPVGLAAWLVDKYRDWADWRGSGSEGDGSEFERVIDRETVLTMLTLYWVTGSIGTSFRQYLDYDSNAMRPMIDVPAAFPVSAEPGLAGLPRSIAERACSNIVHWAPLARGGHFAALEQPDLMAGHVRRFFSGR